MAMFCLDMLTIALELAIENPVYEDLACKFYEHFIYIAAAMDRIGVNADELWDEENGFFYDVLRLRAGRATRLKIRSMVGLIPLFASTVPSRRQGRGWTAPAGAVQRGQADSHLDAHAGRIGVPRPVRDPGALAVPQGHPYFLNIESGSDRVEYEPAESPWTRRRWCRRAPTPRR
jgi:hypothetical protein